jgi:hypothetical protein
MNPSCREEVLKVRRSTSVPITGREIMATQRGIISAVVLLLTAGLAACQPASSSAPTATPTETEQPTSIPTEENTPTPEIAATFTPNPAYLFNSPDDKHRLRGGNIYTDPGGLVYHDGQLHMFINTFSTWPGDTNEVFYYTSVDGFEWERQNDEPLEIFRDQEYVGLGVQVTAALVEDDGTWVLYFYTMEDMAQRFASRGGRATAPSPLGPWTADDTPILEPGPEDAWDSKQAQPTSVIKAEDGTYFMYYSGAPVSGPNRIGLATSSDGVTFTKHNDPATSDAAYAESDPVLRPETGWDSIRTYQPRVIRTPEDGWVMLYRSNGSDAQNNVNQFGLAFSEDGITWVKDRRNPAVEPKMFRGGHSLWFVQLAYVDGVYYMFYELSKDQVRTTQIFTGTHAGSLR